jgi:hypothetical protein
MNPALYAHMNNKTKMKKKKENELGSVPSLSILWNSLRRVGVISSLNV